VIALGNGKISYLVKIVKFDILVKEPQYRAVLWDIVEIVAECPILKIGSVLLV